MTASGFIAQKGGDAQCSKLCLGPCREVKVLDAFHKNRNSPDGRHSLCKECQKEYNRNRMRKKGPLRGSIS